MNFLEKLFKTADNIKKQSDLTSSGDSIIYDDNVDDPDDIDLSSFPLPIKKDDIEVRYLDNGEDLIRAILGDFTFKIQMISKNKTEKFEIISKNFTSNITHPGLIYYLGYCWGKEIGIVLRPDMIWSCILCEFSQHICDTKDKYFEDFNDLYKKSNNVYDGYMTSYDLVDKFRSFLKYDEFYQLITKEKFGNEPKNFVELKILSFCNFSRVKYKKFKMNCNIPKFQIKGDKEDWMKLLGLLDVLIHLISNPSFINYLENVKSLVSNITMNTFQIMLTEPRLRYQGIREMIKDIFYVDDKGGIKGWGSELYFDSYMNSTRKWELDDFNTHISYIPYINTRDREACVKGGGLCYSKYDKECLEPFYGTIVCKINDAYIYKKISNH